MIAAGLVGPSLFLLSLYLHESRTLAGKGDRGFLLKSIFAVLLLYLPTVILILRFKLLSVENILSFKILASLPLILLVLDWGQEFITHRVSKFLAPITHHIKYVMWDSWDKNDCELSPKTHWPEHRKMQFRSLDDLRFFQSTLTCPKVDSTVVGERCCRIWKPGSQISVIDIGGGDGCFTANLLHSLNNCSLKVRDLLMVDPVDWRIDYNASLGAGHGIHVDYKRMSLFEAPTDRQYDLVLASHSLYADLDGSGSSTHVEEALKRLERWRKPNGALVIVLSSRRSTALRFKERAFRILFGDSVPEIAAEDLISPLAGKGGEPEYVDDLIDLTSALTDWDNGNQVAIGRWLNYFLRFPISENPTILRCLVEELKPWVQPFESLPQTEQDRYGRLGFDFARVARVLPHKVAIWTISK